MSASSTSSSPPAFNPPTPWSVDQVVIEDESATPRARRPFDFVRLVLAIVGALLVLLVATAVVQASAELSTDVRTNLLAFPLWLTQTVSLVAGLAGLSLIIIQIGALMLRRRIAVAGELLLAGVLGATLCGAMSFWVDEGAPERVRLAFEAALPLPVPPVPAYLGFLVALVSVRGGTAPPWVTRTAYVAVIGAVLSAVVDGNTTITGALMAIMLGRVAGLGVRLAFGVRSVRTSAVDIALALDSTGLRPTSLRADSVDGTRRFRATTNDGDLELIVLDRDREGAGAAARLWQMARTRDEFIPRHSLTLRADTNQRALVAYALTSAGVNSPALRACLQIDGDNALLAYDEVPGHHLDEVDVTDDLQRAIWAQIAMMHKAGLAHRRLTSAAIRVDSNGVPWLVDRSGGQIAASELAQLTDVVQMLVELARRTSPERAIDNAVAVLGRNRVGRAYPLMQPVVLPRSARIQLRGQGHVLSKLRELVVERAEPSDLTAIELERFKPRTILTAAGLVAAAYLASSQLTGVDVLALVRTADSAWVALALAALVGTYLFDPPALLAFVKQRVSYWRAVGAQLALSFVKLVMPSTIGNAALDVRLLTNSGVPAPTAAAAAAASQAIAVIVTVPLLLILGVATGRAASAGITPSGTAILVTLAVVIGVGLLALAPPVRSRGRTLWDDFARNGLASLLDAVQDPRRLTFAVVSNLGVTLCFVLCFYACLQALGVNELSFAALAVVWLTGNAVGTAVPTPGGLGAVEVALTAGLTTAGVPGSVAVSGVLLFRLISFWLPIPFGYVAWNRLQKSGVL